MSRARMASNRHCLRSQDLCCRDRQRDPTNNITMTSFLDRVEIIGTTRSAYSSPRCLQSLTLRPTPQLQVMDLCQHHHPTTLLVEESDSPSQTLLDESLSPTSTTKQMRWRFWPRQPQTRMTATTGTTSTRAVWRESVYLGQMPTSITTSATLYSSSVEY